MSAPENIGYWLTNLKNRGSETISRSFWDKLAKDLNDYVEGFNSSLITQLANTGSLREKLAITTGKTLLLESEPLHSIRVRYDDHQLHIIFDIRTGLLVYVFSSPKLAVFAPAGKGVTARGEVQLDPESSSFRATSSPTINLGSGSLEARDWPVHDRLAQYLLQKLVVPDLIDDRFVARSS
jgi:hypothetical protein